MYKSKTQCRLHRISALIGGFLLCLPDGGMWSWGNMSVYVLSYIRMKGGTGPSLDSPWLVSFFIIGWSVGMLIAGAMSKNFRRKFTIIIGIILVDGGLMCSYFSVQHSMMGLNITSGAMTGLGYGLINTMVVLFYVEWADNNEGTLISFLATAMTTGGSLSIQAVTMYINPDNVTPKLQIGPLKYFTQISIIDQVPKMYLLLGGMSAVVHIIGLIFIREKAELSESCLTGKDSKNNGELNALQKGNPKENNYSGKYGRSSLDLELDVLENKDKVDDDSMTRKQRDILNKKRSPTTEIDSVSKSQTLMECNTKDNTEMILQVKERNVGSGRKINYKPSEMLRDKIFYILWFVLISNDIGYVVFANYYKQFGQLFIQDDHSLTDIGTAMTLAVAVTRIIWGMMLDRIGVKVMLTIFSAGLCVMFSLFYFTPMLGVWVYAVWCITLASMDAGLHSNYAIGTLRLFGPEHYAFNLGLVLSATIFLNIGAPPLLRFMLYKWSWFLVFISTAFTNFLSVLLVLWGVPNV